ncbi:MAG: polyphosphate kinase [Pirellulaceae bacterium]|nr:MAG: polyphosphate kinase [Pirellulaceae bacterium]
MPMPIQAKDARYFNRELSWLEFNQRVLDEAHDPQTPLLERVRFLAITSTNLDEFFMVRVGGLQLLRDQGNTRPDPAGLTADEQLAAIAARYRRMVEEQYRCFLEELEPKLEQERICRIRPGLATVRQKQWIDRLFRDELLAVHTPMAVHGPEDFPLLMPLALNLCLRLAPEKGQSGYRYAVIPLGRSNQRFLAVPSDSGYTYVLLEDAIWMLAEAFFPGQQVVECAAFRITRNADLAIQEDQAADLVSEMIEVLNARKVSPCVRMELAAEATDELCRFLQDCVGVRDEDVVRVPGPLDLGAFHHLAELPGFEHLKFPPWPPKPAAEIDPRTSMFDILARRPIVLCHPYESFEPVVRLLEEAADDPNVLAIKQTLYRTSRNSPIVAALRRAAENGKRVTAIVELRARFDEERNIEWARNLEQSSVQVIYGIKGFKTHAKLCIIVRREPHGIQRYVHFGTGNYNEITARIYSDISLLTTDEDLGAEASSFFHAISGYAQAPELRKLQAAPFGLREKLLELIDGEIQRRQDGQKALIRAKLNALVDPQIIDALYRASQAKVRVELNVRGICCLRPGVPGLSENITVVSIVDRFLEHARILYFYHGGDERLYISSADWMPRNFDGRIELLVPVEDPACRRKLLEILRAYFRDNVKARRLLPDGSYVPVRQRGRPVRSQELLYERACEALRRAEKSRRVAFEPFRAQPSG